MADSENRYEARKAVDKHVFACWDRPDLREIAEQRRGDPDFGCWSELDREKAKNLVYAAAYRWLSSLRHAHGTTREDFLSDLNERLYTYHTRNKSWPDPWTMSHWAENHMRQYGKFSGSHAHRAGEESVLRERPMLVSCSDDSLDAAYARRERDLPYGIPKGHKATGDDDEW